MNRIDRLGLTSQQDAFGQCARMVAVTAAAWLVFAFVFDRTVPPLSGSSQFRLYKPEDFWGDFRFYLGWWMGLALAPMADGSRHDHDSPDLVSVEPREQ